MAGTAEAASGAAAHAQAAEADDIAGRPIEGAGHPARPGRSEWWGAGLLVAASVVVGLMPEPIMGTAARAGEQLADGRGYREAVLHRATGGGVILEADGEHHPAAVIPTAGHPGADIPGAGHGGDHAVHPPRPALPTETAADVDSANETDAADAGGRDEPGPGGGH